VGYPHLYGLAVGEQQPVVKKLMPVYRPLSHLPACASQIPGALVSPFPFLDRYFGPAANGYLD